MDIPIYILNYNNEERKQRMTERLKGANVKFTSGTNINNEDYNICPGEVRNWSIMLSHLNNIKHFYYETDASHAVICEDDVYIHKDFANLLPTVIKNFQTLNLDVLLLSYLLPFHPEHSGHLIRELYDFKYYSYGHDQWGAHMYLISRAYAIYVIEKFTIDWATANRDKPFSPDWILTKNGIQALVWPVLGVEEGKINSDDKGQVNFHKSCKDFLYNKDIYL